MIIRETVIFFEDFIYKESHQKAIRKHQPEGWFSLEHSI